jgi:uncharacterized protein (TIGR02118 family)
MFGAMIRMSVHYPAAEGVTFDHDYYKNSHVPLCCSTWNVAAEIDKGISGPNVAAVHFFFESMEQFQSAMGSSETGAVMADVPNYTNATPVIQVSEVV